MSIQRFTIFVREKYSYIIISSLILGILVGFYTNYPGLVLKKFSVAFIVVMIASMGFTITFRSFALALRDIKGFSFGMALNFIFAPLLCYAIALAIPELSCILCINIGTFSALFLTLAVELHKKAMYRRI